MVLLLAGDGAGFRFRIEETEGKFRASYLVSLDVGAHFQVQNDFRMFGSASEAETWVIQEATARGFEETPLSREQVR
jgi:hypothetical protein